MATARQADRHTDTEHAFNLQIAELLPEQGDWSEEAYVWLTDYTNHMIEFTDGFIEVPDRDLVKKRRDYAQSRIPEYWIVNPQTELITVLKLERTKYAEHGVFARGTMATSVLLPGFEVSVDAVLDAD